MKIVIDKVTGMQPKVATHQLDKSQAAIATNARVEKGDIRGWRAGLVTEASIGSEDWQTLFQYMEGVNSHWVYFENDVDWATSPLPSDAFERLYFIGDTSPKAFASDLISVNFDQDTDYYKFGAAVPTTAPTIDAGYTPGSTYRAYYYTYVTRYGEETGPSPVDSVTNYGSGNVTLSAFTQPPAGYALRTKVGTNAPKIRVYRTNSSISSAEFQYVGQFDIETGTFNFASGTFTDSVADANLGEVCPTEDYEGVPSGVSGLVGLSNGVFATFKGNTIYFTEPYLPHTWQYSITIDFDVVGIGSYGTNVIVGTEGAPYIINANDVTNLYPLKIETPSPCVSKRSLVSTPSGVIFSTFDGLILVNNNGAKNISSDFLTPTEWVDYIPNSIHGYYYNDKYFGFYKDLSSEGGFILDIRNNLFTTIANYHLAAYIAIVNGKFFTIFNEAIREWEGDYYNYLNYTWKSKKFITDYDTSFSFAQIIIDIEFYNDVLNAIAENQYLQGLNATLFATGDVIDQFNSYIFTGEEFNGSGLYDFNNVNISNKVTVTFFVDNKIILTKNVTDSNWFRLPSHRGRRFDIQVSGYIPVRKISIATNPKDVR